ncbi:MAG: methyltransferase domain-containing protein [Paracoccaceae bacterium]
MAAVDHPPPDALEKHSRGLHGWLMEWIARPGFQSWASKFPLTRRMARKDAERLFDLVSGFAYSQVLLAVVELDLLNILRAEAQTAPELAPKLGLSAERAQSLCQAAAALELISRQKDGRYRLARLGAATLGVPGLPAMIRHHAVFYRDLQDPVALLRGQSDPELAKFWPYVRGETAKRVPSDVAARYSDLMAQTQALVAEETLRSVDLKPATHLMDIGGGTGAFLRAVRKDYPDMRLTLFDLPSVVEAARPYLGDTAITPLGGSFHETLPRGADMISLVRVLYDHADDTVEMLLAKVFDALPAGGRLLISEPMSGGAKPTRSGDVYFSLYTMAMTTGRARSGDQIMGQIAQAGFENIEFIGTSRPFLTSCILARKPG